MRGERGTARTFALHVALLVLIAGVVVVAAVPTATPARAAVVSVGTIQAQMANHRGQDSGTSGNCITYAPPSTPPNPAVSTTLVSTPNEAVTAHGYRSSCPSTLSTENQSAVGFRPSAVTSIADGVQFPIGRMIHYNNPIQANDRYFTGTLNTVLTGFTAPNTLSFNWRLDETPNSPSNVNDEISFTNQISNVTLTQGGLTFKLVLLGFVPTTPGSASCPATPTGAPVNQFSTVEGAQTHACLYASVVQVRSLTVVKNVVGSPPATTTFNYTSSSSLAGSPWANGTFALDAGGQVTRTLTSGETVSVTETDPGDDRWTVTGLACSQTGLNGQPEPVPGATVNLAARQVVLATIPPPQLASAPGITCTYTNTYTPRSTLTLVKQVNSGTAAPSLWTLTATGSVAPPPSGASISGPSGSTAVTAQRVPAGTYTLSETGTGAAATGYVQVGSWACRRAGGTVVPVTGANVTLPDVAAGTGTGVTCTVANRLATGSLQISKVVDAPAGAYVGGTTKTFAGNYDCGPDASGTFSTLTTATPVTIPGIPAGRTCLVTETPPTGGLANASYAWGTPTYSTQPVTITDQGTATVTITNPVTQRFGTFSVTKTVQNADPDAPGGYVGGTTRVFPLAYSCTLTGGLPTTGSLDLTLGQAVSPTAPIPTGSVCTFDETLVAQPGDFADLSYVWSGSTVAPASVTVGADTTVTVGVTNTYTRRFGSLQVAKVVSGAGYLGGTTANFTIGYDCGVGFTGQRTVAAGGSATVTGLPAGALCAVQEGPIPDGLLASAYTWGSPTWAPAASATIPADGTATLTVTNPTIPIFGQVRVTKQISGATEGVTAGASFRITAACTDGGVHVLEIGVGATGSTPDVPVGTMCTITEDPPVGGLIDPSYAWGPTPPAQQVTVNASGEVVAVTMTNSVVRVFGTLSIAKAPITPGGVVDPGRTFAVDHRCVYGNDTPVTGTVALTAGGSAVEALPPVLVGSQCTVNEQPGSLAAPPDPDDLSWVWLPVAYQPAGQAVVTTDAQSITVVNSIQQLTGSFNVTKSVVGAGKDGGYTPGDEFDFTVACGGGPPTAFQLADGDGFDGGTQPALTSCTVTETGFPATPPAYGWDPPQFTVNGVPSGGASAVTFQIPASGAPVQINVVNPITPRLGPVTVTKRVTGATAGLAPGAPPFTVNLTCGPGLTYQLAVPAGGSATQTGIPIGSVCTASESSPAGGLVDASFAWGPPTYEPADGTVTVTADGSTVGVTNPIVRVTAPVHLVKSFRGAQGVVDPTRTYPVTWSCAYGGDEVAGGTVAAVASPDGVELAADVPVTSVCTATEGDLGTPSVDPAFRWLAPVITGTTVEAPGPNTITVANGYRDSGVVRVRKIVTGATEGYTGGSAGPAAENFTLHGQCRVAGQPQIPTRTADGSIADGGQVDVVASIGWTCSGYEDTPGQDLLLDDSYAWAPAVLTPAGTFVLTRAEPVQIFLAENPIVRVRSTFSIVKAVTDPFGVVAPSAAFTGTYSCRYGTDPAVTGTWTIVPGADDTFVVPDLLLGSTCTVTEDDPGTTGLPDGSFAWARSVVGEPVTVEAGGTSAITVANTVVRVWAGLAVTKDVDDPDGGLLPGALFGGVWSCVQGRDTFSDRFSVSADGTTTLFTPADARVPATAVCTITEDTLDRAGLQDGSFAWGEPTYAPADVELVAGQTSALGVTNTVIRVYSDVTIRKAVEGPGADQVPSDRPFTGTISCRYGTDAPIETTWSATTATPALRAGVLVGSVCAVVEDDPGAGGQPVTGDSSYVWRTPVVDPPVTVTPPDTATPPIVVTNPTDRLYGTFDVTKSVSGAVDGIVDPTEPFVMAYRCVPGTGDPITGVLEVPFGATRSAGPELRIPTGSTCTLAEPADGLPELIDEAWSWGDPAFVVDGTPVPTTDRTLTFDIPTPQEDRPEPNVEIAVDNPVERAFGAFSIAKSSDPAPGSVLQPGDVITYSLTVTSTGAVPVHRVVLTDDLSGVLPVASLVPGSIDAPSGTAAVVDEAAQQLVWDVGSVAPDTTLVLTYQVQIDPGQVGVRITNGVTATGDVPVDPCTECEVGAETGAAPTIAKDVIGTPVLDPATGNWIVRYGIVVTNLDVVNAAPYTLSDTLGFPQGFEVRSAAVAASPPGVTLTTPAWNGTTATTLAAGATIPPGATHRYEVTVGVFVPTTATSAALRCTTPTETAGSGLFNSAQVTSLGLVAVDSACGTVPAPVPEAADLRITKVVDRAAVVIDRGSAVRARLVYTITVTNAGPAAAVSTVVTDTLPGGVVPVSAVPSTGTCTRAGATLTCPVGTVAAGATVGVVVTIELPVTYPQTSVVNTARVSSATPDPDAGNNAAVVSSRVTIRSALPITGAQVAGLLGSGAGLLAGGAVLLVLTRRRRRSATA